MFRLQFAAGSVFSASMLDTLLYQAYVKDYVITFVRLLLGIDQAPGSGFLTSMKITKDDMWIRTYGRLYQKLCSTTCEIPIGIYRTQDTSSSDTSHYSVNMANEARDNHAQMIERAEIANLVRSRMESLNLPSSDYDEISEKRNSLSYVIINPSCDLKLEEGDIIYLVRPSPFSAQKTFERHNSRRKSNISFCSQQLVQQMAASSQAGSRRASGLGLSGYMAPRPPPLLTTKANSLSLPDSPTVVGGGPGYRGRSNSLRIMDDNILLRRSNSLRQGFASVGSGRKKSSLEDLGVDFAGVSNPSKQSIPIKIALNGSIGLEVTPPDDSNSPSEASSSGQLNCGIPILRTGVGVGTSASGGVSGEGADSGVEPSEDSGACGGSLDVSGLGGSNEENFPSAGPVSATTQPTVTDLQHLQGTLV